MRSRHSQYSKLGVFQNLYVLLWRGIYYAKKIPNRELQNENLSIFCYTVSTKIPIRNSENMDSGTRGGVGEGRGMLTQNSFPHQGEIPVVVSMRVSIYKLCAATTTSGKDKSSSHQVWDMYLYNRDS